MAEKAPARPEPLSGQAVCLSAIFMPKGGRHVYQHVQIHAQERVARIQAELSKAQEATVNAEKFMNIVRKHMNFEELTHTLLREFVEKILVHECSYDENGTRRQDIEIYYSFVGKVDLPE